ncbi:MAG: FAD-dependent oxidoreductase [Clostridiales bacterium]|nr:FAD-dependent oxidoreductase [Clostridiales bacterium]
MTDIAIIGAGTAGLTAAIYARRAGRSVAIFEAEAYGGQIINTPRIDNYPSMPGVSGFDYATKLYEQVSELEAEFIFDSVKKVEGDLENGFTLTGEYGSVCEAKTIIIASGVKRREMGIPGEQEYSGRGISYCATCDGAFFKGKTAAVFGGGNTAVEDAIYLAQLCSKVYIIHRRNEFRADKALVDELLSYENVETKLSRTVSGINGDDKLTGVTLTRVEGGEEELVTDALFVAIGLIPENSVFKDLVELDSAGYIVADEGCETSCPGVFVAGDCRTKEIRQLVTAAADGAVAAIKASRLSQSL